MHATIRWVGPDGPRSTPRRYVNVHDLIACPTCGARVDESCRTTTHHRRTPHVDRLTPQLCPCGASRRGRFRTYCPRCAEFRNRLAKASYMRRKRAAA